MNNEYNKNTGFIVSYPSIFKRLIAYFVDYVCIFSLFVIIILGIAKKEMTEYSIALQSVYDRMAKLAYESRANQDTLDNVVEDIVTSPNKKAKGVDSTKTTSPNVKKDTSIASTAKATPLSKKVKSTDTAGATSTAKKIDTDKTTPTTKNTDTAKTTSSPENPPESTPKDYDSLVKEQREITKKIVNNKKIRFSLILITFVYHLLFFMTEASATLGQRIFNLMTVRFDGGKMSVEDSIKRVCLLLLFNIFAVFCIFSKKRFTIYDYLSKTMVIEVK
jgi:hypothetical protein